MLLTAPACSSGKSDKNDENQGDGDGSGGAPAGSGGMTAATGTGGHAATTDGKMTGGQHAGSGGTGAGTGGTSSTGSGGKNGGDDMMSDAGGMGGMGGGSDAGDTGGAHKPKCETSPDQIIVIGDSYINWVTHTFPDDLAKEAGETWRMYAVGGCSLGSGGLCLIPDQLDQAIMDDPNIIAGVMTGGGNDILISDEDMFPGSSECKDRMDSPTVQVCQDVVATAMAAGEKLMNTAADAGMRDVIYMFYPHIPGGGFGGENPNALLDYSLPMARQLCEDAEQRTNGKLRCHFIDLVPIFEGHSDWFADDGIHENEMGSAAMAKEVVRVAKENCIAQPESSGCCEP